MSVVSKIILACILVCSTIVLKMIFASEHYLSLLDVCSCILCKISHLVFSLSRMNVCAMKDINKSECDCKMKTI